MMTTTTELVVQLLLLLSTNILIRAFDCSRPENNTLRFIILRVLNSMLQALNLNITSCNSDTW